ncbi:hypothetical protein MRY87_08260 [bacterium]|nr:hypothetical protein [bacterium]
MNRSMLKLFPFLFFLLFSGCYDVPFLIQDESQAYLNDGVIGSWVSQKKTPLARGMHLEISRDKDSPWYSILRTDLGTGEKRKLQAIAHEIQDAIILSYSDELHPEYSIFRLELDFDGDDDSIRAIALEENAPRFANREAFLQFLRSPESDRWFREGYLFRRVG